MDIQGRKMLKEIPARVYEGISFSKGSKPDSGLLSSYFIEKGLFINNKGESPVVKSVPDYISMITTNIDNGNIVSIKEQELSNTVKVFGSVAQVSSEYELTFVGENGSQTRYGVNLFQLIKHGGLWLISSMCWDDKDDRSLLQESV